MAKKTFEQAMKQLEQIVQDLESGDLALEKALKKFEEGIQLSQFCAKKLDETEKKITLLVEDEQGNVAESPFPSRDDD
jgi:exodeoxyribonuclease VII small subunit